MSGAEFDTEFLYILPASVMNDFTRFMDSLSRSDWILFASQVISDQTELRLLEQSPRRTDDLMHKWGSRNGTVGELLKILEGLKFFRARDIILKCMYIFCFIVSGYLLVSVVSTTSDAQTIKVIRWVLWLSWNSHGSLHLGTLTSNKVKL